MYLVDTNIWLERLLDQERSAEVGQFLSRIPADRLSTPALRGHEPREPGRGSQQTDDESARVPLVVSSGRSPFQVILLTLL